MDCCILVIVIVIVIILIVFGMLILTMLVAILGVVVVLIMDAMNSIKRVFWKKRIAKEDFAGLKAAAKQERERLEELKSIERSLTAKRNPADELQSQMIDYRIDVNRTRITDAEAKLAIINEFSKEGEGVARTLRARELAEFTETDDYLLVRRFAEKFGAMADDNDLLQLLRLLETKGHFFELTELRNFVATEETSLLLEEARSKILSEDPRTKEEILRAYLKHFRPDDVGPDDTGLVALETILQTQGLFRGTYAELQEELETMIQELKAQEFERGLMDRVDGAD